MIGPRKNGLRVSANDGDEDAAMIMEYESTMLDAVQDNEDLALTQSSYMDARRRLSERFKKPWVLANKSEQRQRKRERG